MSPVALVKRQTSEVFSATPIQLLEMPCPCRYSYF